MSVPPTAAILGAADTTYQNAFDLLDDFLPDGSVVIIPSYMTSEGMKHVRDALSDIGGRITVQRERKSEIIRVFLDAPGTSYFIVLGTDGLEAEVAHVMGLGIPVMDLCRGLYCVAAPDIALDGSGSDSEPSSGKTGIPGGDVAQIVSGSLVDTVPDMVADLARRVERLEEFMRAHVSTNETGWVAEPAAEAALLVAEETVTYYKSKSGKLRKAGKSKPRPGEVAVELTREEANT